jgi:hypothetical protein
MENYGHVHSRVARWFIFKPKTLNWVNFGGQLYDHLEYFTDIWYNVWLFAVCGHLVYFSSFGMFGPKNLATLIHSHS